MSKLPTPSDPIEVLGEAYELLLEKVLNILHVHDATKKDLQQTVDKAGETIPQVQHLDEAQRQKIQVAVHRDLHSAGHYLQHKEHGTEGWLGFEPHKLEGRLLEQVTKMADPTTLKLLEWKAELAQQALHAGDVTGPGTLVCDACGETIHYHHAGRITPCPRCKGTVFHRKTDTD